MIKEDSLMIKANDLYNIDSVRYEDGNFITLESIQEAIKDGAMKMDIPVAFMNDQVRSGTVIAPVVEDCLVLFHPAHERDYLKYCIRIKRQGAFAGVYVDYFGKSKQGRLAKQAELTRQDPHSSLLTTGLTSLMSNKQKLEQEQFYYNCVETILAEVLA